MVERSILRGSSVVAENYTMCRMIYTIFRMFYDFPYQKRNPAHWLQPIRAAHLHGSPHGSLVVFLASTRPSTST